MKKPLKILLILLISTLVILGGLSYLFTGRIIPSYSCGTLFDNHFSQAVTHNDINSYSNFGGSINYPARDPINGGFYCKTHLVGKLTDRWLIRRDDFKDSYLEAFAAATDNIEACKLIDGDGSKISCILGVRNSTGNKDYCSLITDDDLIRGKCLQ